MAQRVRIRGQRHRVRCGSFLVVRHHRAMIAFEIYINGQRRFTAGGDYPTLATALTLIHTQLPKPGDACILFSTTGIKPDEMVSVAQWPTEDLTVGDRVEIRIVEVSEVDAPESIDKHERSDDNVDA